MRDQDEDAAWREIVENYGERPALDDDARGAEPADPVAPEAPEVPEAPEADEAPSTGPSPYLDAPEERFVPPAPPPLPRPRGVRGLAWLGLFGSPLVLLVSLVAGVTLPRLLTWFLVAAFVAGFAYLVWTMPRGPRDPFDDGARI